MAVFETGCGGLGIIKGASFANLRSMAKQDWDPLSSLGCQPSHIGSLGSMPRG
jgi:hypothetical protein